MPVHQSLLHVKSMVLISVCPAREIVLSGSPSMIIIFFLQTKYHGSNMKGLQITEGSPPLILSNV